MNRFSTPLLHLPFTTVILFFILVVLGIAMTPMLWHYIEPTTDFPTFYYSSVLFESGKSPYDGEMLQQMSTSSHVYPYVYSPLLAQCLLPLTWFDYITAERVFALINIMAVAAGWSIVYFFNRHSTKKGISFLLILILFLLFPFRYIFNNGQIDGILFFTSCCLLAKNSTKSTFLFINILISFATLLKHSFISLPATLLASYKKDAFRIFLLCSAFIVTISIILFGTQIWIDFAYYTFGVSLQNQSHKIAPINSLDNFSLAGVLTQYFAIEEHVFFKIYMCTYIIVFLIGGILSFRKEQFNITDTLLVFSSFILMFSPFLWRQHFVYITAPLYLMVYNTFTKKQYLQVIFYCLAVIFITLSPKLLTILSLREISNTFPIIGLIITLSISLYQLKKQWDTFPLTKNTVHTF